MTATAPSPTIPPRTCTDCRAVERDGTPGCPQPFQEPHRHRWGAVPLPPGVEWVSTSQGAQLWIGERRVCFAGFDGRFSVYFSRIGDDIDGTATPEPHESLLDAAQRAATVAAYEAGVLVWPAQEEEPPAYDLADLLTRPPQPTALLCELLSGGAPPTIGAWGEPRRVLSDDADQDRIELTIFPGENGDWYVATVDEGTAGIGRAVRLATSGGASTRVPGLTVAIADAYRAMGGEPRRDAEIEAFKAAREGGGVEQPAELLAAERERVLDAIRPLFPEVPATRSADVFARLLVTRNREGWEAVLAADNRERTLHARVTELDALVTDLSDAKQRHLSRAIAAEGRVVELEDRLLDRAFPSPSKTRKMAASSADLVDVEHAGLLVQLGRQPVGVLRAVAEVLALLPREYSGGLSEYARIASVGASRAFDDATEGDYAAAHVQMIDAMADLLAGIQACDAAPAPAAREEPAHVCAERLRQWNALDPHERKGSPTYRISCTKDNGGCGALPGWPCAAPTGDAAKGGAR